MLLRSVPTQDPEGGKVGGAADINPAYEAGAEHESCMLVDQWMRAGINISNVRLRYD